MEYTWKAGSHIRAPAQKAGEMCEKLATERRLTAENLVEANRPENAPLHGAFEWRDEIAAEEYRKEQARHIISCICIKRERSEPLKLYYNIERSNPEYKSIEAILQNQDDTNALFQTAIGELAAFQKKYAALKRLRPVMDAIETVKMEIGGESEESA